MHGSQLKKVAISLAAVSVVIALASYPSVAEQKADSVPRWEYRVVRLNTKSLTLKQTTAEKLAVQAEGVAANIPPGAKLAPTYSTAQSSGSDLLPTQLQLNELGDEGWELVHVDGRTAYLKRQK